MSDKQNDLVKITRRLNFLSSKVQKQERQHKALKLKYEKDIINLKLQIVRLKMNGRN